MLSWREYRASPLGLRFPFSTYDNVAMSLELRSRLFAELDQLVLIDPHTHINPYEPASRSLADILGYHYYTELAHSAGLSRDEIEDDHLSDRDKVALLLKNLGPITNTVQYSWFIELARELLGFEGQVIGEHNWEDVYAAAEERMGRADWAQTVLQKSRIEAVFLTNDFDDQLEDFDTSVYIPCLRTDDLVFHLAKSDVRNRLERATDVSLRDVASLRRAIEKLFRHFKSKGARACAISLPPDFSPGPVTHNRAGVALDAILTRGAAAAETHVKSLQNYVFWTLAEMCDRYALPFDLMIGVNRAVYSAGVYQGRDLYDSRVSLIQYKTLFNAFPKVTFPVSVLASVTSQELASYAWIFPNVVTNGHWWYSNTPTFIEHDLAARLEAVPRTKQIGYYSDAYKLEFALPKFNMYKRILSKVLAEKFVVDQGWSEDRAVELGQQLLRGNVESIFKFGEDVKSQPLPEESEFAPMTAAPSFSDPIAVGDKEAWPTFGAASAAGGIGSAMAGIGTMPEESVGGTDFSPAAFQPHALRDAPQDFVMQPGAEGEDDFEGPPISPATGSGFALDESDAVPPTEGGLDMQELELLGEELQLDSDNEMDETELSMESGADEFADQPSEELLAASEPAEESEPNFDFALDNPSPGLDPGLHFRHTSMPENHVAPMLSEHGADVESEAEEREASELTLPEAVEFGDEAVDDDLALDLNLDNLDPEATIEFQPDDATAEPDATESDTEEPKKNDGGMNFDFLK